MEKQHLQVSEVIKQKQNVIASAVVDRLYERRPDFWRRFGKEGQKISLRDAQYHLSYLIESIAADDPLLFSQYTEWLEGLFKNLKFPEDVVVTMMEDLQIVLQDNLGPEMSSLSDTAITAALDSLQKKAFEPKSFLDPSSRLFSLAKQYMDALIAGDRRAASRMILEAVEGGENIKDVYLEVFQATQYEIGRLWYENKISVGEEHFCSASTQLIISQLYPYIFSTEKIGHRLVAACVHEELHEIGIRMVADFFEMDGWDTYYLGANTPISSILQSTLEFKADLLALSVTLPLHWRALEEVVACIRASEAAQGVKILVGGYTINTRKDLYKRLHVDGYAEDAQKAIQLATELFEPQENK